MYYMDCSLPAISFSATGNHGNMTGPIVFASPTNVSSTGIFPDSEEAETKGALQQE
jgi:hypothetical protein